MNVVDGEVQIHADVPRESPTVRGFISFLVKAFNGASPAEIEMAPSDILNRTGLASTLGMMRIQGLSAVYRRIKDESRKASFLIRGIKNQADVQG